jgi:hypothetical protein
MYIYKKRKREERDRDRERDKERKRDTYTINCVDEILMERLLILNIKICYEKDTFHGARQPDINISIITAE